MHTLSDYVLLFDMSLTFLMSCAEVAKDSRLNFMRTLRHGIDVNTKSIPCVNTSFTLDALVMSSQVQ